MKIAESYWAVDRQHVGTNMMYSGFMPGNATTDAIPSWDTYRRDN